MTAFQQTPTGLLVPVVKPEPTPEPLREFGPLEFEDESDRKEVQRLLQKLFTLSDHRLRRDGWKNEGRKQHIEQLAVALLGAYYEFEELT